MVESKWSRLLLLPLLAAFAWAPGAAAQDAESPPGGGGVERPAEETPELDAIEEIVVTGYRRSIQDAISLKRDSDLILEAISAEDIGKLPDVSIAESLSRLPGLAGQRLNGRSQVISVRGLSPDFTTTLLNGRQQVSVGDNRSVEFDQYPSGLIDKVLVYKTPAASLLNHGLAGSVDLRTIRPLNLEGRTVSVNARRVKNYKEALNPDGENQGERFNFFYADQLIGETLGVAFGFSHLSNPSQGEQHRAWGYPEVNGNLVIGGIDSLVRTSELERTALMAVAEWRLDDRASVDVDLYYSNFEETNLLRGLELGLQWGPGPPLRDEQAQDGFVVSGTFPERNTLVRNDVESRETDLFAIGLNGEYRFGDNWRAEADFSYSAADREDQIIESYSGTGYNNMGRKHDFVFVSDEKGTRFSAPALDYTNANLFVLTDPHGWGGSNVQAGYLNEPDIEDDLTQFHLVAEHEFSGNSLVTRYLRSVEFGVNLSRREKQKIANEAILRLGTSGTDAMGNPIQIQTKPLPKDTWVTGLEFLGIPGITSYDPRPLIADGTYELLPNIHPDVVEKSWKVEEDVIQAYAQAGIEAQLGFLSLTGNFGVQLVFSDQKSDALGSSGGSLISQLLPISGGTDYTDVLPSLNLNLQITENQYLRLGLARTLARPRMDEMRSSRDFSFNASNVASTDTSGPNAFWGGEGGNPDLEPWRSNSADISYEFYFPNENGYFSAAAYYKDLGTWVFESDQPFDYSPFIPILQSVGFNPAVSIGPYSAPRNGSGGNIRGYEISLAINGDLFHSILEPIGIVLNYSHNTSAVRTEPGTPEIQLPGLSKSIANVTVFFERSGFAARVAGRYRSKFIGELQGFGAGREFKMVNNEFVVDAQISYTFQIRSDESLSLFLQGTNLNNEPFSTFQNGDLRQVIDHQEYGATWLLGFGYKF